MSLRFRKRIKIMPGLSMNLSKSGVGLSTGTKGARLSLGADGKVRGTAGISGTGIYATETLSGKSKKSKDHSAVTTKTVMTETGAELPSIDNIPSIGIFSVILPWILLSVFVAEWVGWVWLIVMIPAWLLNKFIRFAAQYPSLVGVKTKEVVQ